MPLFCVLSTVLHATAAFALVVVVVVVVVVIVVVVAVALLCNFHIMGNCHMLYIFIVYVIISL